MTQEQSRNVEDEDHDLLTYNESGVRLTEEMAAIESELRACADAAIRESLERRHIALKLALERNSRHADARPGEQGFLDYEPPANA